MAPPKKQAAPVESPVKTTKATRKKKDENAPKRGLSAYMLWLAENRPRLTQPGMTVGDVAKAAGAEWKNVKDRTKWEKQAAAEKERYTKEMEAYKASSSQ